MSEDRFEEFLGPYLLGELSVEEERELERHLEGCSGCRGELARARQTHDLLRELAAGGPPPPELRDHVLARAGARPAPEVDGGSGFRRPCCWSSLSLAPVYCGRSQQTPQTVFP